jgi:hypothetical protein
MDGLILLTLATVGLALLFAWREQKAKDAELQQKLERAAAEERGRRQAELLAERQQAFLRRHAEEMKRRMR